MEAEPCTIFTEAVNYFDNPRNFRAVQPLPFNVRPQTLTWEMLEASRLRRLGVPTRFSRHCNIVYNSQVASQNAVSMCLVCCVDTYNIVYNSQVASQNAANQAMQKTTASCMDTSLKKTKRFGANSLSPFFTFEKKTCGYFFSRDTDNRMSNFGIPATDVPAGRYTALATMCPGVQE
ncbi:hypothetical protein BsWGS_13281 [Bradybaena similaris]